MGLFDLFRMPDIDAGVEEYKGTPGAVLLDVRTPEEFRAGYIPGARSLPLQELDRIAGVVPGKETPLFVYCLSGGRSAQAVSILKRMGYTNVKNIGGIQSYSGRRER